MKLLPLVFTILLLQACTVVQPKAVSLSESGFDSLVFREDLERVVSSIEKIISENGWKLIYKGSQLPEHDGSVSSNARTTLNVNYYANTINMSSLDSKAWNMISGKYNSPVSYIQIKTPTTDFSFGAEIFVVVFDLPDNKIAVEVSSASSQALEIKKLESYLSDFSSDLKSDIQG